MIRVEKAEIVPGGLAIYFDNDESRFFPATLLYRMCPDAEPLGLEAEDTEDEQ